MNIAQVKTRASLALLLHLHLSRSEDVLLTSGEASELLGITSRTTLNAAKEELVALGLVSVERKPHGLIFRLLSDPIEEMVEQDIDPLEAKAYEIDRMDASGNAHQQFSGFVRRRKRLALFVGELLEAYLPARQKLTPMQIGEWVVAAEKNTQTGMGPAWLLLSMLRRYTAHHGDKAEHYTFKYVLTMLSTEGTESEPQRQSPQPQAPRPQQQSRPAFKKPFNGNEDGLSDDEIQKAQQAHIEADRARYGHLLKLPRKQPAWRAKLLEEGED